MRIVNRKKFIRSMAILIFLLIGLFNISIANTNKKEAEIIDYTITPGETLWSIAGEYTPNSKDVRETIYEIKKHDRFKYICRSNDKNKNRAITIWRLLKPSSVTEHLQ